MASEISILFGIYLSIIILLILAGNLLIIFAFALGSRRMKTYTNYYIVNLAVSDLLVGVLIVPYWIYFNSRPLEDSVRGTSVYKVFEVLDILFGSISIFSLLALTIERLIAVKFPTFHFNMTWKPVTGSICLTWLIGFAFSGLGFLVHTKTISKDAYLYTLVVLIFTVPTISVTFCYIVIFQIAKESSMAASKRVKKDLKIARMILIIIGLFILCWMPFFALNITYNRCKKWCNDIPKWTIQIVKALHYSNSMMNFWVYAARNQDFRRSFEALIRWRLPRFRSSTMTSYRMRQRTMSNPSSSTSNDHNKNHQHNGNIVADSKTTFTPVNSMACSESTNGGFLVPKV